MHRPILLFYSYSHKDEQLRDELIAHLAALRRSGLIEEWHDRKILAGDEWDHAIRSELETAEVILMLISSDFLASSYVNEVEVKRALERHKLGEARVIPIILRPVALALSPFSALQALPKDAKPVIDWPTKDHGFVNVCEGILAVVRSMREQAAAPQPAAPGLVARVQSRVLDAAIPERVEVQKSFVVLAMIRFEESGGLKVFLTNRPEYGLASEDVSSTKAFPIEFPTDESGAALPVTVTFKIDSPGCEPPAQTKTLQLSPGGETDPRIFLMVAKGQGRQFVNVELYQGAVFLAECLLSTEAVSSDPGTPPVSVVSSTLNRREMPVGKVLETTPMYLPAETNDASADYDAFEPHTTFRREQSWSASEPDAQASSSDDRWDVSPPQTTRHAFPSEPNTMPVEDAEAARDFDFNPPSPSPPVPSRHSTADKAAPSRDSSWPSIYPLPQGSAGYTKMDPDVRFSRTEEADVDHSDYQVSNEYHRSMPQSSHPQSRDQLRRSGQFPKLLGFGLVLIAAVSLSAVLIPNILSIRPSSNTGSAAASLRTIVGAQATYAATTPSERYGSLSQLAEAGLIDAVLATGEKSGYRFRLELQNDGRAFEASAEPATPDSGDRSFYTNESGKLWSQPGQVAGTRDAPGELMGE